MLSRRLFQMFATLLLVSVLVFANNGWSDNKTVATAQRSSLQFAFQYFDNTSRDFAK